MIDAQRALVCGHAGAGSVPGKETDEASEQHGSQCVQQFHHNHSSIQSSSHGTFAPSSMGFRKETLAKPLSEPLAEGPQADGTGVPSPVVSFLRDADLGIVSRFIL